ncbi:MAG TPA: lytic transglycosylase domain-containing protein [Myxococcales bacterium]|nr:lytic transglycosylase domain-containing protein [Myxococcales bacterium]
MTAKNFRAFLLLSGALVVAGAAADVWLLDRPLPVVQRKLKDSPPTTITQAQLEALLGRIAPALSSEMRSRLGEAVLLEANRAGYDPLFVLAMVSVESGFHMQATSERGARGLVQIMPSTFAWISAREPDVGGDDYETGQDPVVDVRLAVRYFRWLERRFGSRDDALMAYNAGPKRLRQYKLVDEIPDRIKEYPRRVKREYTRFVGLLASNSPVEGSEVLLARAQSSKPVLTVQR